MNIYKIIALQLIFTFTFISLQAQKEVDAFRGVKWGTPIDSVKFADNIEPNFLLRANGTDGNYYIRENEDYTIGTALLEKIYYVFNEQDKLYKVLISGKSSSNEAMEYILQQRLGKADKRYRKNRAHYVRIWNVGDVEIVFFESKSKDFSLKFESKVDLKNYIDINANIDDF